MSAQTNRPSRFVATYLLSSSCDFDHVWFVNPRGGEILGRPVFPSLHELSGTPDLVDVFRQSDDLPGIAEEVAAIAGVRTLWLQLGLRNDDAAPIAHNAGKDVVMDRCLKIEHARLAGGRRLAGFDTGVISSRRHPAL